jgi:pimeloyl-ACP methyl ester carboxylesterase
VTRHLDLVSEASVTRFARVHGHDVAYRQAGEGPLIVLVHGVAGSSSTWVPIMPLLAERFTVVAPDLLGHGESAKPRGDYSLGAYASGIRDLLVVLGHDRATFVGHSLGGGIAMQLAYQYPHLCERLVLLASGGLGKEVSMLLRVISLPGAEYVMPVVMTPRLHGAAATIGRAVGRLGLQGGPLVGEIWSSYARLTDRRAQLSFVHTVRAVIDVAGQRINASDRLYLAQDVPTLIVWGDRDAVIPVSHGHLAHELIPGSRLEIVEGAGHFLVLERPDIVEPILTRFLDETEPAEPSLERWRTTMTQQNRAGSD